MPRIEVLTVGDELVEGRLVDTNSATFSARLAAEGLAVTLHTSVGDDREELVGALRRCADRCDAVLISGGLGPTCDDLTAECAAEAFDLPLERSAEALGHVRSFFADRGRSMTANNEKQADLPRGCHILPNPNGTAVGFRIETGACALYFVPGVPRELGEILEATILPDLVRRFRASRPAVSTLKLFGRGESEVAHLLEGLGDDLSSDLDLKIQYRATFPEIHVRLVLEGADGSGQALTNLTDEAAERLGRHVFAVGGARVETTFAEVVAGELRRSEACVAVADACTGGALSRLLLSGGDEQCLRGAVVAPFARLLEEISPGGPEPGRGSIEEESVAALAAAVRARLDATHGLALAGAAEPGTGPAAGTLLAAVSSGAGVSSRTLHFPVDRVRFQVLGAYLALTLLRRSLATDV